MAWFNKRRSKGDDIPIYFDGTYYSNGYLCPVPKTEGLPKKLIYKFGEKATGWHAST